MKGLFKQVALWLAGRDPGFPDRSLTVPRALEGRIVFCVNCDTRRPLQVSSASGSLVCSTCESRNWTFEPTHAFLMLEATRLEEGEQIRQLHRLYNQPFTREERNEDLKSRAMARVQRAGGGQ